MQRNGKLPHPTLAVLEMPAIPALNDRVRVENEPLQAENESLQTRNKQLHVENEPLQAENNLVQTRNDQLQGSDDPVRTNKEAIHVYRVNDPIERRFVAARINIETALQDANLLDALAPYGYDRERLLQGQALLQQAQALVTQQQSIKGDLFAATDARIAAQEQAHAMYRHHVAIARLALQDDRGAAQKLDLSGRKRTQAGWLFQSERFYTNALANPAITAKLARYGITYAQLTSAQQQVAAVATSIVTQQQSKQSTQEAMQARDAALQALNRWMRDFRAVARMALANQPQRLAQLGLSRG